MKKTNPRHIPRTEEDCRKALYEGHAQGVEFSITMLMYILADKFGFSDEQIAKVSQWYNTNAHAIDDGDIKFKDVKAVLADEYKWQFDFIRSVKGGRRR